MGRGLIGLLMILGLTACNGSPPPQRDPGEETKPEAPESKTEASGKKPTKERPKAGALEAKRVASGTSLAEPETGVTWIAPGAGTVLPGARPQRLSYDTGFRLTAFPLEVRVRLERVKRGGDPTQEALRLARAFGVVRTDRQVDANISGSRVCKVWGVDAAAAAAYPKRDGPYDWEEIHVLVKGRRALLLWKQFDSKVVFPELWSELNGRMNASLSWGGRAREIARRRCYYVDADWNITPHGSQYAIQMAKKLRGKVEPRALLETASRIQELAFSEDFPDETLERPSLIREQIQEGAPAAIQKLVAKEMSKRIKTYRDLRALQVWLRLLAVELKG